MNVSGDYRILSVTESTISTTNQKVLVFGCSEVSFVDPSLQTSAEYNFDVTPTHTIVLDGNTGLAIKYEKSGTSEDLVTIEWDGFPNKEEKFNGEVIHYHKSVILKRFQLWKSPISSGLESGLGHLYYNYHDERVDHSVFAQLRNEKEDVNVYLIAKKPDEDIFYCILESPEIKRKTIALSLANIIALEVWDIPVKPFKSKYYIQTGKKELNDFSSRQITPHVGIDKVTFGMSSEEILNIFGNPDSEEGLGGFKSLSYRSFGFKFSFSEEDKSGLFSIEIENTQYMLFGYDLIGKTEHYLNNHKKILGLEDLVLLLEIGWGINCYKSPSLNVTFWIDSGIIKSVLVHA